MADITLSIADQHLDRVIHALCVQGQVEETPANAKAVLFQYLRALVFRIEREEALATAEATVTYEDGLEA